MLVIIRTDYPTNMHTEQGLAHKSSHQNPRESENQAAERKQRPQDLAQRKFVELTAPHLCRDHLMITRLPRSSKVAHLCLTTRVLWEASLQSKEGFRNSQFSATSCLSIPSCTHTAPAQLPLPPFHLGCCFLTLQAGPMTKGPVCKHKQTHGSSRRHSPARFRELFAQMAAGCWKTV